MRVHIAAFWVVTVGVMPALRAATLPLTYPFDTLRSLKPAFNPLLGS
jgi:hypothetical protein